MFENETKEVKNGQLRFAFVTDSGVPGTMCLVAIIPSSPIPVGIVWYRVGEVNRLDILSSYVEPRLRRLGIRTAIHERMFYSYSTVTKYYTGQGNEMSTPWLKKNGFKKSADGWLLRVRNSKKKYKGN